MRLHHLIAYEGLRRLSNFAFNRYMNASRDGVGQEWYHLHQWALRKAHTLRVRTETEEAES